jgi:hypothetical protein
MRKHLFARRCTALFLLCTCLASTSCSFLLTQGPPRDHAQRTSFECTQTNGVPATDVALGVVTLFAGVGVLYGVSAFVGFKRVGECNAARREATKAFREFLAIPESQRPDASIVTVVVTPSAGDTLRVGGSTLLRAAAMNTKSMEVAGRAFVWSSSDSTVASVTSAGEVSAKSPGSTTITATTGGVTGARSLVILP